jgi:predicted 3-demethylubiquinone-9 3-methyltransferase (glyoxalase superfamily)
MPSVTPFLWFNDNAEEAMKHYTSIFKHSKIVNVNRLPGGGMVMGTFEIEGQRFHVLNGGPAHKFNPAISLFVSVETQAEVDEYYGRLLAGGREDACGWLQDKFGLSWQIVPTALGRLMGDKDQAKAGRVMQAMMQMKKIDIAALQRAYDGA